MTRIERRTREIRLALTSFVVGAMAVIVCYAAGIFDADAPLPAPTAAAQIHVAVPAKIEYECQTAQSPEVQQQLKTYFERTSFTQVSPTEFVSVPEVMTFQDSFVSFTVHYRSDSCGFTVEHERLAPTDELLGMPYGDRVDLVYTRDGYYLKKAANYATCTSVLPPLYETPEGQNRTVVSVKCGFAA